MTFEEWWTQRETVASCDLDGADNASAAWGYQQERIDDLEAIIKAHQIRPRGKSMLAYLPEGYVLVPVEPTEVMLKVARNAPIPAVQLDSFTACSNLILKTQYKAMIQAAQEEE